MKKISIIIPIYNCESIISYCIDSICKQSLSKDLLELILVDDASSDGSLEKCRAYASKYDFIKVLALPENVGPSEARNKGVLSAEGEYIFFADSDDWLGPDCLQRLLSYAEDNNTDVVIGRVIAVDYGKKNGRVAWCRGSIAEIAGDDFENTEEFYATMGPWGRLVKKDILTTNGIVFPSDMYMYEDIYWNVLVLHHASSAVILNDYDYYFLRRDKGIASLTTNSSVITNSIKPENIYNSIDKLTSLAEEYGYDEGHPLYKRIFRVCVRDGYNFISTAGTISPEEYPDLGRVYKDKIWQRVKCHYSPEVRSSLNLSLLCRLDAVAAGLDIDSDVDPIRFFALAKYTKGNAVNLLDDSIINDTSLPSFLSNEALLRLSGAQAESYSFSSTFQIVEGTLTGDYFIALKVTDNYSIELAIKYDTETYYTPAILTPDVWGEKYQESGKWEAAVEPLAIDIDEITFNVKYKNVTIASGKVTAWDSALGRPEKVDPVREKLKAANKSLKSTKAQLTNTLLLLDQSKAKLKETKKSLKDTKSQLEKTKARLDAANNSIKQMRSSYSWRVTKPLRQIRKIVK